MPLRELVAERLREAVVFALPRVLPDERLRDAVVFARPRVELPDVRLRAVVFALPRAELPVVRLRDDDAFARVRDGEAFARVRPELLDPRARDVVDLPRDEAELRLRDDVLLVDLDFGLLAARVVVLFARPLDALLDFFALLFLAGGT